MIMGCAYGTFTYKLMILSVGCALITTKFDRPWIILIFTMVGDTEMMTSFRSYIRFQRRLFSVEYK